MSLPFSYTAEIFDNAIGYIKMLQDNTVSFICPIVLYITEIDLAGTPR